MPKSSWRTRTTPASPPGEITVLAWTVESYCSKTQRLLATDGESNKRSSASDGVGCGEWGVGPDARNSAIRGYSVASVAARARSDREHKIAHALRGGFDEILLLQDADAHRVDERIAGVAGREVHFATACRHADAVAVVADAANDAC